MVSSRSVHLKRYPKASLKCLSARAFKMGDCLAIRAKWMVCLVSSGPMTKVNILYAAILRGYKLTRLSIIFDEVRRRVGNLQLRIHQSPMTCASHKLPPRLCFEILRRESMSISRYGHLINVSRSSSVT